MIVNTSNLMFFFIFVSETHPLIINKMCNFILLDSCPMLQLTSMENRICTKATTTDPIVLKFRRFTTHCYMLAFQTHCRDDRKPKYFSCLFFSRFQCNASFLFFQLFDTLESDLPLDRFQPPKRLKNHQSHHLITEK